MRRALLLLPIPFLTMPLIASCGGRTTEGGGSAPSSSSSSGSASSASSSGGSSSSGSGGETSDGGGGSSSSGGDLAYDGGSCPAATIEQVASPADAPAAVAGRWQVCAGLSNVLAFGAPSDTVGMEFTQATSGDAACAGNNEPCVGGEIYYLVEGSSGLVRGQGAAYQIWYSLWGEASDPMGASVSLDLQQTPSGGSWTTAFGASASPRELDIESIGYNTGATLVAVP